MSNNLSGEACSSPQGGLQSNTKNKAGLAAHSPVVGVAASQEEWRVEHLYDFFDVLTGNGEHVATFGLQSRAERVVHLHSSSLRSAQNEIADLRAENKRLISEMNKAIRDWHRFQDFIVAEGPGEFFRLTDAGNSERGKVGVIEKLMVYLSSLWNEIARLRKALEEKEATKAVNEPTLILSKTIPKRSNGSG